MRAKTSLAFASMLMGAVAVLASPADAACKKFGFTVNDYGKDGPTNDAKNLLDKHISEWAAQNGVSDYSTGKKTVSCELFLDVILFDEHTCTASATVCWGPDAKKLGAQSAAAPEGDAAGASAGAPPAPVRKAHAMGHATEQAAAAAAAAPAAEAASAAAAAPMEAAPTAPVEQIAAPDEAPAAAPAVHSAPQAQEAAGNTGGTTGAVVETGALQAGQALPHSSQKPATAGASEKDRAAAATAAASAAAAAERAAVAAETAANAAKEAAAAAVAASAASKGSATVPPLNHASGGTPAHAE